MNVDFLRATIRTVLESGDIVPGYVKVLKALSEPKELVELWKTLPGHLRHGMDLTEDVKEGLGQLDWAYFCAVTFTELATKELDDAALAAILEKVKGNNIPIIDKAGTEEGKNFKHCIGLELESGWIPLYSSY